MSRQLEIEAAVLEMRRVLPAAPEVVFAAWTMPERMQQWFAPGAMSAAVEVDLRVGGSYRIEMRDPDGSVHATHGTWREIVPNRRLVFTWGWEGPDRHESLVTVELFDRGGSTELLLRHERLASAESRSQHEQGWLGCLEKLERVLQA
ncbi:SRPBCC domain-containing protein [Vulgatibacter sp.]|uniref:SRPBCC family protein n=1 Tax=Vulgatibacter sp. TaxID=1971226 RepID=UPI0035674362